MDRWSRSESAERTNAPAFLIELCDLLGLDRPEPATGSGGAYRFERGVRHRADDRETKAAAETGSLAEPAGPNIEPSPD